LLSLTSKLQKQNCGRKALHIVTTSFLEDNEVLVHFSDGTAAIYEEEELENLRPKPKQTLPACPRTGEEPFYADAG
jgi:hypothetical protein